MSYLAAGLAATRAPTTGTGLRARRRGTLSIAHAVVADGYDACQNADERASSSQAPVRQRAPRAGGHDGRRSRPTDAGIEHLGGEERASSRRRPTFAAQRASSDRWTAYRELYRALDRGPGRLLGRRRARAARRGSEPFTKVARGRVRGPRLHVVRGRRRSTSSANCLDRHLDTWRRNKAALIWEGDDGVDAHLHLPAAAPRGEPLRQRAARRRASSRATASRIYLPMIPELADRDARVRAHRRDPLGRLRRLLGHARCAGASRTAARSCSSPPTRACAAGARWPLKAAADEALFECPSDRGVHRGASAAAGDVDMEPGRDTWWHQEVTAPEVRKPCEPEPMDAEDPLFILYTSGSTGKPKGVAAHHRRLPALRAA